MTVVIIAIIFLSFYFIIDKQNSRHVEEISAYKRQVEDYKKLVPKIGETIPMSHFRSVVDEKSLHMDKLKNQLEMTQKELSELKSQQQSKSVRLGLISENVLPFHSEFKYNVKDLVPLFRPVDYLVFAKDEIVFLEIKIGTSQLSDKQKKIRHLIESGKVRFEEHRVTENGYSVKENHGAAKSESRN